MERRVLVSLSGHRTTLMYEPLKAFMPIAAILSVTGVGKLLCDAVGKDFRLATNTLLTLLAAFTVGLGALLSDLIVRLNRPKDQIVPMLAE